MLRSNFLAGLAALPSVTLAPQASPGLTPILSASTWLGRRLHADDLRDRVVLVDVFTFECINCTRVTPNLQRLHRTYSARDFAIVAVHTPEVPSYQSSLSYLRAQSARAGIDWPIVVDNDYHIWNAYGVNAWPTQLVFDRRGTLGATIVGDSQDGVLDRAIAATLSSRSG